MKIFPFLFFGITILFFTFCKTVSYTSPSESTGEVLYFGQGGGFTGILTEFALLPNGQIFKKTGANADFEILKKVKKSEAKQAFENYKVLNIKNLKTRNPGNVYFYIRHTNKEKTHEIVWGRGKDDVSSSVKTYYKILNRLVKDKQSKS